MVPTFAESCGQIFGQRIAEVRLGNRHAWKMEKMVRKRRALLALSCCVLLCDSLLGQTGPQRINVVVVEGEGAINRLQVKVAKDPVVRVEDEKGQPVLGATVVFTLPTSGASGNFNSGAKRLTVSTDDHGLAVAQGLRTNEVTGTLAIDVNASYRGETARAIITEFNHDPSGTHHASSSKLLIILAVVGGSAAGGAYFATHKSGSSGAASVPTVTLTPGSTSVGAP